MNWATILVLGAVAAALAAILAAAVRNRKKGKPSCPCGGACSGCPMGGSCHPDS